MQIELRLRGLLTSDNRKLLREFICSACDLRRAHYVSPFSQQYSVIAECSDNHVLVVLHTVVNQLNSRTNTDYLQDYRSK